MPCIAPPPPQIAATIQVGPAPDYALAFTPADAASANYIAGNGDLDFSCFAGSIRVQFTITTPGVVFYKLYGKDAISFAEDASQPAAKQAVQPGHHQFPGGVQHVGPQTIAFTYHNDWDGGAGDHRRRYARSAYGIYLGSAAGQGKIGGFLHHCDPIVSNGGNQN